MILAQHDANVWKSFRNFPGVRVRTAVDLCAYDVLAGGTLIAESAAMEQLTSRVAKVGKHAKTSGDRS